MYHHIIRGTFFGYSGTFDEFVDHFLNGHVESDSYWKFVGAMLDNEHEFNVLHVKYEELKEKFDETAQKINKFLDYDPLSDDQLKVM